MKHFSRDGSKISYVQNVHFDFDAVASAPYTQDDRIVALNMHMNVGIENGIEKQNKFFNRNTVWEFIILIMNLQAFLQVFEREITDIFQGFANRLNSRLNQTPGVRVLKRLMERIRGKRKVILSTTNLIESETLPAGDGLLFNRAQTNSALSIYVDTIYKDLLNSMPGYF